MARILLITNPFAARIQEQAWQRVARALEAAGWQTEVALTAAPGHARELAQQGVEAGMEAVAVFGGDGTTMQVAGALVGTGVALGLIPGGTGNLLAGNLRIPADPLRAVRLLSGGKRRTIDLGRVTLADGEHYFGVAAGCGIDARVMGETAGPDKRRWGIGAYMATAIRVLPDLRNTACVVSVDGKTLETHAALVLVMNCGEMIPPLVRIRPEISPDDGILDLVTIAADSPWQGLRGLFRVIVDGRRGEIRETPYIRYARGSRFTVEASEVLAMQSDGEPLGSTPFTVEVVPGALTVLTG